MEASQPKTVLQTHSGTMWKGSCMHSLLRPLSTTNLHAWGLKGAQKFDIFSGADQGVAKQHSTWTSQHYSVPSTLFPFCEQNWLILQSGNKCAGY